MREQLRPCMTAKSAYDIDYKMLRRNNVRLVMFDIDNTLVPHGCTADQKCRDLIKRLKDMGFHVILISNAKKSRVGPFARSIKAKYTYKARKPKPKAYRAAMRSCRTRPKQAIYIGDQIFTDMLGANRAGVISCLVDPISPNEGFEIRIKRPLERLVMKLLKIK